MNDFLVTHPLVTHDGGMAPLYLFRIEAREFSQAGFYEGGLSCSPEIARSSPKRQAEHFYGRKAARRALADFGLAEVTVGTGTSRQPLWPKGIVGSISHNDVYAGAITLDARIHGAIGIDMETVMSKQVCDNICREVTTPRELDFLKQLDRNMSMEIMLTILFSAKESFFKAAFPTIGRFFGFHAVELCSLDLTQRTFCFRVLEDLSPYFSPGTIHRGRYDFVSTNVICTFCNWPPFFDR